MQFLADVELICEECKGTRFKSGILEIRYNGLNIHEVLQLTVREAISFFHATPRLVHKLKVLDDVGLGYLRLGQSATTLSGGEAQRVKLAAHLAQASCEGHAVHLRRAHHRPALRRHRQAAGRLRAADRKRRQPADHRAQSGRDPRADWVIDLGPEGGPATKSTSAMWFPSCCRMARCCTRSRNLPRSRANRFIPSGISRASLALT
jgi:excinuclease ABC subunit A